MDTNTWTNEEIGVYFRLLLSEWVNGSLPNDPKKLAKIVRISTKKFQKLFPSIQHKFNKNGDGTIYNQRMEDERQSQLNYTKFQQEAGRKGAAKRWENNV